MTMSTNILYLPRLAAPRPSRRLSPPVRSPGSRTAPIEARSAQPRSDTAQRARLSELAVTIRRDATSVLLTASGALDIYTVDAFRQVVERCSRANDDLIVDLDQVSLIDSAGLHTLRTLGNRAQASGHRLRLVCQRRDTRRALAIAGMTASATIAVTEARVRGRPAEQNATTWIGQRGHIQTMPPRMPPPQWVGESGTRSANTGPQPPMPERTRNDRPRFPHRSRSRVDDSPGRDRRAGHGPASRAGTDLRRSDLHETTQPSPWRSCSGRGVPFGVKLNGETLSDAMLADYAQDHAKYEAVIETTGVNHLTAAETAALTKLESTFGIRQISEIGDFPAEQQATRAGAGVQATDEDLLAFMAFPRPLDEVAFDESVGRVTGRSPAAQTSSASPPTTKRSSGWHRCS